jgi:dienelactone hydrolase
MRLAICLFLTSASLVGTSWGADLPAGTDYLKWVREEADRLTKSGSPLVSAGANHLSDRTAFIKRLESNLGIEEIARPALDPVVVGRIEKPDYVIERVHFQTLPGIRMPGNVYLPKKPGRLPAVLHVHGHWSGAKQDPVVQARCVACVRAGFVVLVVDAFGAGERAIGAPLGEYHGGMTAATLLPVGKPLAGIQMVENVRAVDYLISRPEVDPEKLGVTGASGGGNQSMYAGAYDTRLKAVVPVCSVGNYKSYLGAACCMCEVVPGALQFTEEDAILASVAPRALKVISASRDARQFSPGEAAQSIGSARSLFAVLGRGNAIEHQVFESGHDYSKPMRESMVGFMKLHLLGQGNGQPVPEAEFVAEPRDSLRCFAEGARPADWKTLPQYSAMIGTQSIAAKKWPTDAAGWEAWRVNARPELAKLLNGQLPIRAGKGVVSEKTINDVRHLTIETEQGITLPVTVEKGKIRQPLVIVLHEDGAAVASKSPLVETLRQAGAGIVTLDLRATGKLAVAGDRIGLAPDHNSAEWALWLGRPLAGQWAHDISRVIDTLERDLPDRRPITLVGMGPMGIPALLAATQDDRIATVAMVDTMLSWISDKPYGKQRLATMIPHVIPRVGDIAQIAAITGKTQRLVIAGGVDGQGNPLDSGKPEALFRSLKDAWSGGLQFCGSAPGTVADALTKR